MEIEHTGDLCVAFTTLTEVGPPNRVQFSHPKEFRHDEAPPIEIRLRREAEAKGRSSCRR